MATESTVSIPGIQFSLLEQAKKMRDRQAEERDLQRQDEEAAKSKRVAESREVFLSFLDRYAGTILRQLDTSVEAPVIENATSNWFYRFKVAHTVIELVTPENLFNGRCKIGVSVKNGYFCDSDMKWVNQEDLSDCLLNLVGLVIEQYEKYHFLAAEIDQYNFCLKVAAQKTENDIASDKTSIWTWPDRAILNLYKITWTKGGYYDSDTGESYFQYEHGWSLSDRPDDSGYFQLLTPTNRLKPQKPQKLKVVPITIECVSIGRSEDVPPELMVAIEEEYEFAIASQISIHEAMWNDEQILDYKQGLLDCDLTDIEGEEDIFLVFPEHIPKTGAGIPDLVVRRTKSVELGQAPCLEIRLAV